MTKPQKTPIKPKVGKTSSLKKSLIENKTEAKVSYPKESFFNKVKRWLTTCREWLTLNKIFFEVPAALLLSVMAVTLSYWQWQVSKEQTEYLHQQTFIGREQAMPQIIVIQEGIDSTTEMATKEEIFIYNQGNIARNIDVFSRCLLSITTIEGVRKTIPIANYYGEPEFTQNNTGLLATIDNEKMFTKVAEIEREIQQLSGQNDVIRSFGISRNIMVYYTDIFGGSHRDFFEINPIFGAQPSIDNGVFLEDEYFDGLRSAPDFASITVKDILDYINNK